MALRRALVVQGGWPGHDPARAVDEIIPLLTAASFDVTPADDLAVYEAADLPSYDLIVQCWTMGRITEHQFAGLSAAVLGGTGFAGWHGGIADSFRSRVEYLQLVGAQFVAHPGDRVEYGIDLVEPAPEVSGPDVRNGVSWPITVRTEQYWVLSDDYNDVWATTTLPVGPDTPWRRPVTCPAIWTRQWGRGKVFVSTVGHDLDDLRQPDLRLILDRGMAWAARCE